MGSRRWWQRAAASGSDESLLRQEVERLTQENMRLRLEQQRPRNLSSVTEQLRAAVAQPAGETDPLEARDEAHHVLAQAEVTRRAILDVLDNLVVAAGQMQRQLLQDIPLSEIDRRVTDRRDRRGGPDGTDRRDRRGAGPVLPEARHGGTAVPLHVVRAIDGVDDVDESRTAGAATS